MRSLLPLSVLLGAEARAVEVCGGMGVRDGVLERALVVWLGWRGDKKKAVTGLTSTAKARTLIAAVEDCRRGSLLLLVLFAGKGGRGEGRGGGETDGGDQKKTRGEKRKSVSRRGPRGAHSGWLESTTTKEQLVEEGMNEKAQPGDDGPAAPSLLSGECLLASP